MTKGMAHKVCTVCSKQFYDSAGAKYCGLKCQLKSKTKFAENECWIWTGDVLSDGYGRTNDRSRYVRTHRASYEIHVGPIPKGMVVCHRCDVRLCLNPDHLFLGTPAQNSADMCAKSRQAIGERASKSNLTEECVRAIRKDVRPHTEIARERGVTAQAIYQIRKRKTWKHVE